MRNTPMKNFEYDFFSSKFKNLATIGMLSSSLFHDVQNMLSGVEVSLLRMKMILDSNHSSKEKLSQAQEITNETIDRLSYLKDLLKSSTSLLWDESAQQFRLDDMLHEITKLVSSYARHANCQILLNAFAFTITSQEANLKRAIINLLFYLIKHMDSNTTRQIVITMDEHSNILFSSENMGFQEALPEINTPLDAKLLENNQLDLYIARELINEVGGKIFISNKGGTPLVTVRAAENITYEQKT